MGPSQEQLTGSLLLRQATNYLGSVSPSYGLCDLEKQPRATWTSVVPITIDARLHQVQGTELPNHECIPALFSVVTNPSISYQLYKELLVFHSKTPTVSSFGKFLCLAPQILVHKVRFVSL